MTNTPHSGDAVHFAVDNPKARQLMDDHWKLIQSQKPIPNYMGHARDGYLPLDQRPPPVTLWPYVIATMIAVGCVFFVVAYIWRG